MYASTIFALVSIVGELIFPLPIHCSVLSLSTRCLKRDTGERATDAVINLFEVFRSSLGMDRSLSPIFFTENGAGRVLRGCAAVVATLQHRIKSLAVS